MTHLCKRNGVYYFRRKIPLELRHFYTGKSEIIFSLKTKNRSEAEPLARKLGVQYDEEFSNARAEAPRTTQTTSPSISPASVMPKQSRLTDGLTIADFDLLVGRYVHVLRRQREEATTNPRAYEQYLMNLRGRIGIAEEFLALGEHPLTDEIQRPLWHVEAELVAAKAVQEGKTLHTMGYHAPTVKPTTSIFKASASTTFDALLDRWAKERKPDQRSITYYGRAISKLTEYTGIEHVELTTKANIVKFKDKLLEDGTTSVTANNYLTNLTTLFNFAIGNALIETNPAQGIRVQVRQEDKKERLPFTVEQLNLLFSSPIYSQGLRPEGGKGEAAYWLPLLGLFTGARLNELCQLNKVDVRQERYHDVAQQDCECWVLSITDEGEGQKLKNSKSKRRFPIHAALIQLGFIDFVASSPGPRVFHELMASKTYSSISSSWSKWFARYLHQIGLKTEAHVFHSFRHSFKFYSRQNSIPDAHQYAIQGHSSGKVGDEYGGAIYPLAPLVTAIQAYIIPNLVLPPPAR